MDYEKLQKLNDQRRYIEDLKFFKNNFEKNMIKGEHPRSIVISVKTNFNGMETSSEQPIQTENLRSPYDGCPMREEDLKDFLAYIDTIILREEKKFQEM